MAEEQDQLDIDPQGYIQTGRFAGQHISTVARYAVQLEEMVGKDSPPAEQPKPPGKPDPNKVLLEHSKDRVDAATALTWQRLEADDEAEFSATVPDYEKHKEQIQNMKKTIAPPQRIVRGLHKFLYMTVRSSDPAVQAVIFGTKKEEPAQPKEGEDKPAQGAEAAVPVEPPAPPVVHPKAAPPSAAPTPVSREAPASAQRKPKLKATDKVIKAARNWGMDLDEYLILLEDQGTSQDELNAASQGAETRRQHRSTVYDRPVAR
jgi:hypothetical protein